VGIGLEVDAVMEGLLLFPRVLFLDDALRTSCPCVLVCCSVHGGVLQCQMQCVLRYFFLCVTVCCGVLRCVAVCCNVLQSVAVFSSVM